MAGAILGLGLLLMLRGIITGIAGLVSMHENRSNCSVEIIQLKQMDQALHVGLISILVLDVMTTPVGFYMHQ